MKNSVIKNSATIQFIKITLFGLVMLISACNRVLEPNFEGTYVNATGSEFSIAHDTLVVELDQGNEYLIHRKTGFRLLDEQGKPGKSQHESEEWMAVYDPREDVMTEKRHGKIITFNPEQREMTVVRRKYKRIN
jgi:hypothetical protein